MSGLSLDWDGRRVYGAAVSSGHEHIADGSATATFSRSRRRRKPSAKEQARREAWGREWGPKVGRMIRQSIARSER